MKVNRGIIELGANQTKYIMSVGHIFNLEKENLDLFDFKDNQKILGASIDNKFNICYNFEFKNNKSVFGYISEVIDFYSLKIQAIDNFEGWNNSMINSDFKLNEPLLINKSNIKNIFPASF